MPSLPENEAAIARVEEWMRTGRLEEAEALCREIAGRTPGEGRAWIHLGTIRFVRGAVSEAEIALKQGVALNPKDNGAWNNLSAVLFQQGKLDEARFCAEESVRHGNQTAAPWINLGHVAGANKNWIEAAEAYRRAVAIDSTNSRAWSNLATCEQELGKWKEAEAAYQQAIRFGPGDVNTRANYGWLLTSRGRPAEALGVLEPALIERSDAASAWTAAGHARSKLGDRESAAEAYRKALALEPKNRFARHGLAVVLRLDWKLTEAEAMIRALLAEDPSFAQAWALLAGMQSGDEAQIS
jgi:tetratricopeptide (TPR) repeat protein